jgi:methylglutaconyl-CoA hydratase
MMNNDTVLCDIDAKGVAHVTLNRPDKHNALDPSFIQALTQTLKNLEKEKVRALWLKANGKSFCAGADLLWMKESTQLTKNENIEDALQLGDLFYRLYHMEIPTIASIQGGCYGGGIGLMACCKIVIASVSAQFCFREVRIGLAPAMISPYILAAIGPRLAEAFYLTGETFSAQRAYEMHLCHQVVDEDQLIPASTEIVNAVLKGGPLAHKAIRQLMNTLIHQPISEKTVKQTADILASLRVSQEGQEGIKASIEKRTPYWMGSNHD